MIFKTEYSVLINQQPKSKEKSPPINKSASNNKIQCNDKNQKLIAAGVKRSSISYNLYTYRKELERRRLNVIRLAQAKINLTDGLVINNAKYIHGRLNNGVSARSVKDEMDILTREVFYKKKLYELIKTVEEMLKKKKEAEKQAKKDCEVEKKVIV